MKERARASGIDARELKAKMCGRFPDGRPLAMPKSQPLDDFDYSEDTKGYGCPFGSHVRRLNPREGGVGGPITLADALAPGERQCCDESERCAQSRDPAHARFFPRCAA